LAGSVSALIQTPGPASDTADEASPRTLRRYSAFLAAAVALTSLLPMVKTPSFYFWDDTAASFVPIWHRIGELVNDGQFPLLQIDMWRGGNLPAEAAAGIYNPLILVLSALTSHINDLALAAWAFKVPFLVLLAVGVFLLAIDFGSDRRIALFVGYAAPFAGFTLWSEASTWVAGLMILSFYPWIWRAARRMVRGEGGILAFVIPGVLCLTVGNPYAVFTVATAVLAALIEGWVDGVRRRLWLLVGSGIAVLLVEIPVLLPFVMTYSVGYREPGAIFNDDFLRPGLTDLVGLSNPVLQPFMPYFSFDFLTYPGAYLGWFIVPTLAWVAWRGVPGLLRAQSSLVVTGAVWLLLVLAPSSLSFFRWPIRLLPYLYITILVAWAVVMSRALARDHRRARWLAMFALVGFGAWIGFGERPVGVPWQLVAALVTAALCVVLVRVLQNRPSRVALVAIPATFVVLALQLFRFPSNENVTDYDFPTDTRLLQAQYEGQGRTLQIAAVPVPSPAAYSDVLFGSMQSVAGRESPNAYSGIGFAAMDNALCMLYNGQTCPELASTVFDPVGSGGRSMADYLALRQVVVAKWTVPDMRIPDGWRLARQDAYVRVLEPEQPVPDAHGTVSVTGPGVDITSTGPDARGAEQIEFVKDQPARWITLARLSWPGYSATVDGQPVALRDGPGGLVEVELPADTRRGTLEVSWSVPGARISGAVVVVAIGLTIGLLVLRRRLAPDVQDA
jgi:hypothetical protein